MIQSSQHTSDRSRDAHSGESSIARRGFLHVGTGLAATAVGIGSLTGQATAHFPSELEIDINPGSEENPINQNSNDVIPVAVIQTDDFDPTSEDIRYRFGAPDVVGDGGGARPAHDGHVEDEDGDGRDDLALHFPTDETGFDGDESEGRLEWERTQSGEHGLSGKDTVSIVGQAYR